MTGICELMLIKYISHPVGVNGTQITINLILRALLSRVPKSWHTSGKMERMRCKPREFSVCARQSVCLCVTTVYSELSKEKERGEQE